MSEARKARPKTVRRKMERDYDMDATLLRQMAESFRDQIQKSSQRNRHEPVTWDTAERFNHILRESAKILPRDLKAVGPLPLTQATNLAGMGLGYSEQKYVDLAIAADQLVKLLQRMEPPNRIDLALERSLEELCKS
jgi:hypothetical protein